MLGVFPSSLQSARALPSIRAVNARDCYPLAGRLAPWFAWTAALLCTIGLFIALRVVPTDPVFGDHFRIVFIHNPATWMAVLIFLGMLVLALAGQVASHSVASILAASLGPTGAMFAFLALWSGSLLAKPEWGTWWVWDARLTAILGLMLVMLAFNALQAMLDDPGRADRLGAWLLCLGVIGAPATYLAMTWWGGVPAMPTLVLSHTPGALATVLAGLLVVMLGLCAYSVAVGLTRMRIVILERERGTEWASRSAGDCA